jgi:probable F420-dependent oxidoreductase
MTRPKHIGIGLLSRAENTGLQRAQWAEQQGFDSVWIPDGDGKMHALTLAGAVAATTRRIALSTSIVPIFTHTPAVLAASAMTLAHLAPGRVALGLGSSSKAMMEGWNGIPFDKPLTRMRETVQVLRRMLAGERVEFSGQTLSTRGFRLNPLPPQPVPIYLAALRPNMLELAGELADGVILNLAPLRVLPRMLEHVAAGARRAGRSLAELDVVYRFNGVVTDDRAAGLEDVRAFIARYFAAPVYNRYFAWCGYEAEAQAFREGFARGDRAATAAAITDALVAEVGMVGTEAECQAQVRAYFAAGMNTASIIPLCTSVEATERAFLAFAPKHFKP